MFLQTKTSDEHDASRVVVFCKPVLATLRENKTLDRSHASRMLIFLVFCEPMLAILLQ